MLQQLQTHLAPAVQQRVLLLVNHCIDAEDAARERLVKHAGRGLLVMWSAPAGPWPRPSDIALRVTPAGLFELAADAVPGGDASPASADLRVDIALPAPHRLAALWLSGERPNVSVDGDAQFAADVAWLAHNLRWDVESDLARLVGGGAAHQVTRVGQAVRDALRRTWERRPARA